MRPSIRFTTIPLRILNKKRPETPAAQGSVSVCGIVVWVKRQHFKKVPASLYDGPHFLCDAYRMEF